MPILQIKKLKQEAIVPTYAHASDSGMDLFYCGDADLSVQPGERALVPTGIAIGIPIGYEAQIRPKSGMSLAGHMVAFGTIDQAYIGELKVVLYNFSRKELVVKPRQKVGQLVIAPVVQPGILIVDELNATDRGANGFGSTGMGTFGA